MGPKLSAELTLRKAQKRQRYVAISATRRPPTPQRLGARWPAIEVPRRPRKTEAGRVLKPSKRRAWMPGITPAEPRCGSTRSQIMETPSLPSPSPSLLRLAPVLLAGLTIGLTGCLFELDIGDFDDPRTPRRCERPNPALQCPTDENRCVPSSCSCDGDTGTWTCTEDCGGGGKHCQPPKACAGPNPAEACRTSADQCIPSTCGCSEGGGWVCTKDCGGGRSCGAPQCTGEDPANACRRSPHDCIPSACGCGEDGTWICTADCGGGTACEPEPACDGPNPAEACRKSAEDCIPSVCGCGEEGWYCTDDCGGGKRCR